MELSVVGKRVQRLDAREQVTGKMKYADDMPRFPNMLHAKLLTSASPSAKIARLDTKKAKNLPGVAAVITAKDVPGNRFGLKKKDEYVYADGRVKHVGQAIAAVAAKTVEIAEEAVSLIKVDYDEVPPVFDPREAMKTGAPQVEPGQDNVVAKFSLRQGDMEAGFSRSDVIVEDDYETHLVEHCHLEPHGGVAKVDHRGKLTIWSSNQLPFTLRILLFMILKMPASKIRVIKTDVGGGFGGKNELSVEHHLALLALKTRRPVKMIWTRKDEFQSSTLRHRVFLHYKTGAKRDGRLMAMEVKTIIDNGSVTSWSPAPPTKGFMHIGPYKIPNVKVDNFVVSTNMPLQCSMRGFGHVPQVYAVETHIDHLAKKLGMNPIKFRLENALKEGDTLPTGQVLGSCGLTECIKKAAKAAG
jgi:CO/xanthine dehydrogenase Mo-binding subunit